MKKFLEKQAEQIIASLIFFIPFITYLITLFPTVPNEDGGELITAAYSLGIAHPPGYPLLSLVGKLFTLIIPFGNIAWRTNVMSAFLSAATALLTYLLIKKIATPKTAASTTPATTLLPHAIAAFCALLLAFSDIFWSQAIRMEAYALNSFFTISVFYLLYSWYLKPEKIKLLIITALTIGLSITNHQIAILIAPAAAIFVIIRNAKLLKSPKLWAGTILAFLIGASVYAYLPIRSAANPALDWGNPETSQEFWAHVSRSAYAEKQIANSTSKIAPGQTPFITEEEKEAHPISSFFKYYIRQYFLTSVLFIKNIFIQLFYLPAFLALFTITLVFNKKFRADNPYFIILPIALIFFIFPFEKFINVTTDAPTNRPFYLQSIITSTLLLSYGLIWLSQKITNSKNKKSFAITLLAITLLALTILPLAINFSSNNQSKNFLAFDLAKATLHYLPENSILYISSDDNRIFPILYLQEVENFRKDVTIYNISRSTLDKYPLWENWQTTASNHPATRIFTDAYTEQEEGFVYAPHTPFAIEMVPADQYEKDLTHSQQKQIASIFNQIPCRNKSATNLDYQNQILASNCYFHEAINLIDIDNSASQEAFESGITASQGRIQDLQDIYPYYYVAHIYNYKQMYRSAIIYLQRGLTIMDSPVIAAYLEHIIQKIDANPL